jgi:hypothetical protein
MSDEDRERRHDEFLALSSMYKVEGDADGSWQISLEHGGAVLEIFCPVDYPSTSAPTPLLFAPCISEEQSTALASELLQQFSAGEECIFSWVTHVAESLRAIEDAQEAEEAAAAEAAAAMAAACAIADEAECSDAAYTFVPPTSKYGQRVRHFGSDALDDAFAVEISSGEPFHPPKSGPGETFQAHVCSVSSMGHVNWALATLLQNKRIARATHNMLAYRFLDASKGHEVQVADNDDDGESSSGAKLAALLELTGAQNVLVVVSRWYGGIHLGPARFKYIASVGRQLLDEKGHCQRKGGAAGAASRKGAGHNHKGR